MEGCRVNNSPTAIVDGINIKTGDDLSKWIRDRLSQPKRMVRAVDSEGNIIECDADKILHVSPEKAADMIKQCPNLARMLVDVL